MWTDINGYLSLLGRKQEGALHAQQRADALSMGLGRGLGALPPMKPNPLLQAIAEQHAAELHRMERARDAGLRLSEAPLIGKACRLMPAEPVKPAADLCADWFKTITPPPAEPEPGPAWTTVVAAMHGGFGVVR